jgi:hypothetical protein
MLIMVAGPYTAATAEARRDNLDRLNDVAAQVLRRGHVPIIGVNVALPVMERSGPSGAAAMTDISRGLAEHCDAVLMVAESPGANREREVFVRRGRPVYRDVAELPDADASPPTAGGDGAVTLSSTTPDRRRPLAPERHGVPRRPRARARPGPRRAVPHRPLLRRASHHGLDPPRRHVDRELRPLPMTSARPGRYRGLTPITRRADWANSQAPWWVRIAESSRCHSPVAWKG